MNLHDKNSIIMNCAIAAKCIKATINFTINGNFYIPYKLQILQIASTARKPENKLLM
ncbi:hypothetical protein CV_1647 [Chromobacterium violaceum ATCC 12472]|uniref:Uncharacterized protein n=1 Tax=Chromobacterium violaceum (strain ATCC 12472 / DSM 30191 / JCM 1249 / CCUG 213 / NBRC 12614 / NCIMB 9131 / NCTC 9757 / MK) TaxID=243365 RepID=Q7NXH9_CHRVO|nr:hypothetical protein CV_1647 [Chromobacterium violaceum ATCC 12472]